MTDIAKAIAVVGLAGVSAYLHVKTKGESGGGWAVLAFLILIL